MPTVEAKNAHLFDRLSQEKLRLGAEGLRVFFSKCLRQSPGYGTLSDMSRAMGNGFTIPGAEHFYAFADSDFNTTVSARFKHGEGFVDADFSEIASNKDAWCVNLHVDGKTALFGRSYERSYFIYEDGSGRTIRDTYNAGGMIMEMCSSLKSKD